MRIQVKLFATLVQSLSGPVLAQYPEAVRAGRPFELEMPEGSTLADLVTGLALPDAEVKVIFVNGRAQQLDYRLQAGDTVGIFPPIGGG
jgi:molybdopterin converting factor small subunit